MRKVSIINWCLATTICVLMAALFYVTQRNYKLLNSSNQRVILTANLITGHINVVNDFKNALIYNATYKNSPTKAYLDTYGKGLWEIYYNVKRLKRLVSKNESIELDKLLKQITIEEDWLRNTDSQNAELTDERDSHVRNIVNIQSYFDKKILDLRRMALNDIKSSESYSARLNFWISTLIIATCLIMLVSLFVINSQLRKVQYQNKQLSEIAWIQSHKVRAEVANVLGLSQLLEKKSCVNEEDSAIISKLLITTQKLDAIVKEINAKSSETK